MVSQTENQCADKQLLKQQTEATLAEYNMLREEMRMFIGFHRRDTQLTLGIVGTLVSVYLSGSAVVNTNALTFIIPSVLFVYFVMQIFNLHMVSVSAKACARIETRINKLLGGKFLDWESKASRRSVRGPSSPTPIATGSVLLLVISVFVFFSVIAYDSYGIVSLIAHGIELLIMVVSVTLWARFELWGRLPD